MAWAENGLSQNGYGAGKPSMFGAGKPINVWSLGGPLSIDRNPTIAGSTISVQSLQRPSPSSTGVTISESMNKSRIHGHQPSVWKTIIVWSLDPFSLKQPILIDSWLRTLLIILDHCRSVFE